VVKNLAANAGKFCKRIIHVSLRKCKLVLLKGTKKKVNKSKSHNRSVKIKIRIKSIYSINIRSYIANITHNTRYNRGKKYGRVRSIYKVHIGKCNIGHVCKKPVWRAGKLWVYKQYGKCTVSIHKQKATGKSHASCARSKSVRKSKYNKKCTYVTVNICKVVYSRLSKIYAINVSNCEYNTYQNRVTEYTDANKWKVEYSLRSRINVEKDRRRVRYVNISIIKGILMVTVRSIYRSVYVTRMVNNGKTHFSVSLKMDPRTAEELDKDMDTDTHKTVVTHGKNCSRMFSGDLTKNPGVNYISLIHTRLQDKLSVSRSICYRPFANPCDVLSINNEPIYSNPSSLLCLVDNDTMSANLTLYPYTCLCAYQYGVIYTVNVPHQNPSISGKNIIYVYSTTPRLYKASNVHSTNFHTADGDISHTCRIMPSILGQTRKGINYTVSKSNSWYGE
jgi:hypothetical protein